MLGVFQFCSFCFYGEPNRHGTEQVQTAQNRPGDICVVPGLQETQCQQSEGGNQSTHIETEAGAGAA